MSATMTQTDTSANGFVRDERGVMMVVGCVSAAFLIGAVWFIWGVGQAAVFRENMQSAADATAYQMSVYDARGMNIIALINLIMSVVLTVWVCIRILQAIFVAVNIVSCLAGAFFDPVCDITTAAEPEVTNFVDKAGEVISTILKVMSYSESGIAIVWPFFASGTSPAVANDYAPAAQSTIGLGTSNIPLQAAMDLGSQVATSAIDLNAGKAEGGEGAAKTPAKTISVDNIKSAFKGGVCAYSGKYLLPVQADEYKVLCSRAGANVATAIGDILNMFPLGSYLGGLFKSVVAPIVGMLVVKFEGFFCEDDTAALVSIAKLFISGDGKASDQKAANTSQKDLDAQCQKKADSATSSAGKDATQADKDKIAKSLSNCKNTLTRTAGSNSDQAQGEFTDICSKGLYDSAKMFDINFQNWGFAFGSYTDRSAGIVGTANGKTRAKPIGITDGADLQIAQSEFYYEPKKSSETSDDETAQISTSLVDVVSDKGLKTGADNYMWNPRWRARLRRVRAPQISIGAGIADMIGKAITTIADTKESDSLTKVAEKVSDWIGEQGKSVGDITIGGELVAPEMVH